MGNLLGNVELGITLSKKNLTNELVKTFGELQSKADENSITYKIAGDKSSMEAMLKQIQGMKPELRADVKLNFDKSYYEKEMSSLKGTSGKTAEQIGKDFSTKISDSLSKFSIKDIIGKNLKKSDILQRDDVGKLKSTLQDLMNQTKGFDLSKATSVTEIENQVVALQKMNAILETLSKHSSQKSIKIDGNSLNIANMLQENTSSIDSIMGDVGNVIQKNASQWATTLESTFNKEYGNIVNLINNLREVIGGIFDGGSGSGSGGTAFSQELENIRSEIEITTKEIEKLEEKLKSLESAKNNAGKGNSEVLKSKLARFYSSNQDELNYEAQYDKKGKNVSEFKNIVNEYMQLGGLIKDLTPGVQKLATSLKIEQIVPPNVTQEIESVTNALEAAKIKRDELLSKEKALSQQVGTGSGTGGAGTDAGTGNGTGTPSEAIISPKLSGDFKQKLQEQVTAIGSIDAAVDGKLSETFKTDIQTAVDNIGKVDVGVSFSNTLKDGEKKQEIPVDVTTTPKLSETFQSDLQKLVDDTGKYNIKVSADSNNQDDLVPVNVKVGNGEDFKSELKKAAEGDNGLDVKVNPILDNDFKLEIPNVTLKDVKIDGSIQGGNLKPDSIEKPSGERTHSPASVNNPTGTEGVTEDQDKLNDKLEKTKQKHEEVGQAAIDSGNKQKHALLEAAKEYDKIYKKHEEIKKLYESSESKVDISAFNKSKKSEIEKEYTESAKLIEKIQLKMKNRPEGAKATVRNTAQYLSAMIMYVKRLQEIQGKDFSFDVLGKNGEEIFKAMNAELDNLATSTKVSREEFNKWHNKLAEAESKKSSLEKIATDAEKLELEIYDAVKALEKLKAVNKKGDLIKVDSKTFEKFWDLWLQYKSEASNGKLGIADFTNDAKVINTVSVEYNKELANQADRQRRLTEQRKRDVVELKKTLTESYQDIDLNKYSEIFKKIEDGQLRVKAGFEQIKAAQEALIPQQLQSPTTPQADPNKPGKPLGEGEVLVTPKVEDPVAFASKVTEQLGSNSAEINVLPKIEDTASFAGQITEQLKGQNVTIDVNPNIVWDNVNTSNDKDVVQNKEFDEQVDSYNRMIEKMNEYIECQRIIAQGNKDIVEKRDDGTLWNTDRSDYRKGSLTQAALKRQLNEYLKVSKNEENIYSEDRISREKNKLATYVAAFNDANKAQDIFGKNNKSLFAEIQIMIDNARKSLEAFETSKAKLSGTLINARRISAGDTMNGAQYGDLISILKTGDIDKAVQHLQQVLGLQIPQAAQQAKAAIDGIGEQARQEGQEASKVQIPISVVADITSLNNSIQSKKDQITPVDIKLSGDVTSLNESIQSKKDQILPADITLTVSKSAIKDLNTLSSELTKISDTIKKIVEKPLSVQVDYSSIKGLYEIGEDGASPIDKLKQSINGLQTGVLKDLKEAFQGFSINKDLASRIEEVAKSLSTLKITLNNIDSNSLGFLNIIKDLSGQADGLRDLATVIRASKEEVQKAKDEINKSQGKAPDISSKDKYTILKDTLNEVLKLTKEYNKESNEETKSGIASQIQLYKDRADTLQLELWDLEKINAVEQNRVDIIQDKIRLEENKQENKELANIERQIAAEERLEAALTEQESILAKDSNEWGHALELLSLYKNELQDVVKITRNIKEDKTTGFKAISYQFTDSIGSTKTVGANKELLMENTKIADLNDLYSKLKNSANEYYALQLKILKGDVSTKTQYDSLVAYNKMIQLQQDIFYWKQKGLVPSQEQLKIEERLVALSQNYNEQEQKSGLLNMYTTVLNTVDRLNKKQQEVNDLRLKSDGTNEFADSIQNAQNNVSTLIATLRGFKFEDFFTSNALSSLGLNGSSILFDNNDLNSFKWVIGQLPFTEEQIQKINDVLDKNTLIKEKNAAAQNKINDAEQKKESNSRTKEANDTYNEIEKSLKRQADLTKQIMQADKDGRVEKSKELNNQLVTEFRNCDNLILKYKSYNDVVAEVDANLEKLFSDSRQRFSLLGANAKDDVSIQEQKLLDQMATGREKAALKSQKLDRYAELAQAKAINKALEDEYKRSQNEQFRIEQETQRQRDQFYKSNMNGIDFLIQKREEEAKSFSIALKAQMEAEQAVKAENEKAKKNIESFNKKDQIELYSSLSKAVKDYVYWLKEENSLQGGAKTSATTLRSEAEALMNSLRSDIKDYGLQDLEKELELDRQILEARQKINHQDEVAVANMAKNSYERELRLEEKKNRLQMNNIGANAKTTAKNNVRIQDIDNLIKKEQEYRDAMGLSDKAQEAANQLINKRSSLTHNLKVEQDAYNESVKAGNKEANKQFIETLSKQKDNLTSAISNYTSASSSKLTEAQDLLGKLQDPISSFGNIDSSNVKSAIRKIEKDTNDIIDALRKQHEQIQKETKYSDSMISYRGLLKDGFNGFNSQEYGSFYKLGKSDKSGRTEIQFIKEIGDTAIISKIYVEDLVSAIDLLKNGKFDVSKFSPEVIAEKNVDDIYNNKNKKNSVNEIKNISSAYKELINTEERYYKLVAKRDANTITSKQNDELERLILSRKKANELIGSIPEGYKFDSAELEKQEKYNLIQSQVNANKDSFIAKEKIVHSLLEKTNIMMSQFEGSQIKGFDAVFDRAKLKVDALNDSLRNDTIKNIQTGYEDKVNKIVNDLKNVVAVADFDNILDPNLKTTAIQNYMHEYAATLNDGKVKIGEFTNSGKTLNIELEEQGGIVRQLALEYNELDKGVRLIEKSPKKAVSSWNSFLDGLKARFKSLAQYLLTFVSFYRIWGTIKQGVTYIKELDTALTEMRKVSDESTKSLKNFQGTSFDIAKSVGSTAKQIQNSTADFMRLGESIDQAAESAKVANILLNVSEFESIDEATESLVSMSAAYDELGKMQIVDKLNMVGNNFAISTDGLATALQNSASALKTAKNDIDESIALATAANAVVQDPDKVGAGLRTIALRITGTEAAKEELEEMGENVDDYLVTTTSKLNEQVISLTKTVGKDGISLLDDNGNYRSTYEILQDIADIWEELGKEDLETGENRQNALLEMLAGKNRSNILASILQSPETLREAYNTSLYDSEGSAQEELDKYLDSIAGKMELFTNEVQEFWYNFIDSETVKGFVDLGTKVIDVLGDITGSLGEMGTVIALVSSAFSVHSLKNNSGGRDKMFSLVIKYATESFSREVCEFWCISE